jgi:Rrf2 family protein
MLRLSKKVEYGLIAIRHLALLGDGATATSREISDEYSLPYELCCKTLSQLSRSGLIRSTQGTRGGFMLNRAADVITVEDVIISIEGDQALTECMEGGECALHSVCTIKDPLRRVHETITEAFRRMTLAEMI